VENSYTVEKNAAYSSQNKSGLNNFHNQPEYRWRSLVRGGTERHVHVLPLSLISTSIKGLVKQCSSIKN